MPISNFSNFTTGCDLDCQPFTTIGGDNPDTAPCIEILFSNKKIQRLIIFCIFLGKSSLWIFFFEGIIRSMSLYLEVIGRESIYVKIWAHIIYSIEWPLEFHYEGLAPARGESHLLWKWAKFYLKWKSNMHV